MSKENELRICRSLPTLKREEGKNLIVGYAARFNEWSHDLGGFRERIARGAFADSLKATDILGLYNHNPDHLLGRNGAGTIKIWEDEKGLMYEINADTEQVMVKDLLRRLERKDLYGSSFGFRLKYDDTTWEWPEDESSELPSRTILRVEKLYDVGPVSQPAYPTTTTGLRSSESILQEFRDMSNLSTIPKTGETWADELQRLERRLNLA